MHGSARTGMQEVYVECDVVVAQVTPPGELSSPVLPT